MRFLADWALGRYLLIVAAATVITGCGDIDVSQSGDSLSSATTTTVLPASGTPTSTTPASSTPASSTAASTTPALIALSANSYLVEPASSAVLTIYRIGSSEGEATVAYSTVDGTAAAGTDYIASSGQMTWQDGDMVARQVSVPVKAHAAGKSFGFALSSVSGNAYFGSPDWATISVDAEKSSLTMGSVTLSWAAPTFNTDGTKLTNLYGFNIFYGAGPNDMTREITIAAVSDLSYVISNLSAGTWYFQVVAVNSIGAESGPSITVHTTI